MKRMIVIASVAVGLCLSAAAQVTDAGASVPVMDGLSGFLVNLATTYPWLATILLIIGGLRVIFKPIISLIDSYVKANWPAEEYAKLQSFEAGPVYRWLCFGLDFVGSVKLPVIGVKPQQK